MTDSTDSAGTDDTDAADAAEPQVGRTAVLTPRPVRPRTSRHPWRLALVGAVLVGALVFLLVEGLGGSLNYFETVDQALAQKTMLTGKTFRLEGVVEPGSVQITPGRNGQPEVVAFVADGTRDRIAVVNTGNPPQLFCPSIPVVLTGHFDGDRFVSDQIVVDHTPSYAAAHPDRPARKCT